MPISLPERIAATDAVAASLPSRLDEPRMEPMPIDEKKAASHAPSLLALMRL